jgi:hypothetical protein
LFVFVIFVLKIAVNQIVSFPLQFLKADILNLRERGCRNNLMNTKLIACENCEAIAIHFIAKLSGTDL